MMGTPASYLLSELRNLFVKFVFRRLAPSRRLPLLMIDVFVVLATHKTPSQPYSPSHCRIARTVFRLIHHRSRGFGVFDLLCIRFR